MKKKNKKKKEEIKPVLKPVPKPVPKQEPELKPKSFMKGLKAKLLDKFKPAKTMLIEMTHTNGTVSHSIVGTNVHKFTYNGLPYIVDEERKVYNNSTKLYMLRYHEGFALPYAIEISSTELKRNIPEKCKEISTSYNPFVLKDVLKFEYAKGVIQGAEVHEFIRRSFIMSIIILVAVIAHLVINVYKSGWI